MTTKIYALTEPDGETIRYIGKTVSRLSSRLQSHLYRCRRNIDGSPKGLWIRSLIESGEKPRIKHIRTVSDQEDWVDAEKQEIAKHKDIGFDLLNVSDGGNGSHQIKNRIVLDKELLSILGVLPDSLVAQKLGVTRKAVTYHREKLGIPASFDRSRNKPPPKMGGHNKIQLSDHVKNMLGKAPDASVAKVAGCSKPAIRRARIELGIPSFAESYGKTGRFDGKGAHPRWGTEMKG